MKVPYMLLRTVQIAAAIKSIKAQGYFKQI